MGVGGTWVCGAGLHRTNSGGWVEGSVEKSLLGERGGPPPIPGVRGPWVGADGTKQSCFHSSDGKMLCACRETAGGERPHTGQGAAEGGTPGSGGATAFLDGGTGTPHTCRIRNAIPHPVWDFPKSA